MKPVSSRKAPRLLVTDRNSCVLLERARVHVSGRRVVYYATDDQLVRRFNLPHCNVALLLLGQGTSITQEAMASLGEEGVHVAFTGSGGTPLHMGALTTYKATAHFRRMMPVYASMGASLAAAKSIQAFRSDFMRTVGVKRAAKLAGIGSTGGIERACERFLGQIYEAESGGQLLAREGEFAKAMYREVVLLAGVDGFVRQPGANTGSSRASVVNRFIDHGNYLAYGIAGAAIWALGIPPHMSVLHGKTRAGGLVFDLADAWKDSIVLPAAVKASVKGDENMFRALVIDAIDDLGLLARSIKVLEEAISAGEADLRRNGAGINE